MKALIASSLLFLSVLALIIINCRYLEGLSEELCTAVESIPRAAEDDAITSAHLEAFRKAEHVWRENRSTVSLSAPVRVTEGIDDCMGEISASLFCKDAFALETAREHLLRILEDLRRYDAIRIGSVF